MPADIAALQEWAGRFPTQRSHLATDPSYSIVPLNTNSIGTPMQVIVDPATMTIVHRHQGYDASYQALTEFLSNGG